MVRTESKLITFLAVKDGEALYSQKKKKRLWSDCSSDHQLCIAKFRLILKKVWKNISQFRCDLNKILNNYTVEVTNKFKGLDLVDRVPEELRIEVHDLRQEAVIKTNPRKNVQKGKMAVWGGFTNSWIKKRSKRQGRKGKIYPNEFRVPEHG